MKSFSVISCYAAVFAVTVVSFAGCSELQQQRSASGPADDGSATDNQQPPATANRRSVGGEYHGLYAPTTYHHGHYAPAAVHHHGHGFDSAATAVHYHAAGPDHYHLHADGYAPAHYHGYAPGHYHFNHAHEIAPAVHEFKQQQPIVYQSVVNTYPTATTTTVVHKPVPVPVAQPVPVPVARPVPIEVPRPYPVPVNRPYPVAVIRPVPVPVAQPYPVTVYRPYPVPVYRPLPGPAVLQARPAVRVPVAVRVPPAPVRPYPATSYVHSHRVYAPTHSHAVYAPSAHSSYPHYSRVPSYIQQLAAIRVAQSAVGAEYEASEAAAAAQQQQTALQEDAYSFLNEHQHEDAAIAADVHHQHSGPGEDGSGGYPSLTADETFKNSLGVPSTDYAGSKK